MVQQAYRKILVEHCGLRRSESFLGLPDDYHCIRFQIETECKMQMHLSTINLIGRCYLSWQIQSSVQKTL